MHSQNLSAISTEWIQEFLTPGPSVMEPTEHSTLNRRLFRMDWMVDVDGGPRYYAHWLSYFLEYSNLIGPGYGSQ